MDTSAVCLGSNKLFDPCDRKPSAAEAQDDGNVGGVEELDGIGTLAPIGILMNFGHGLAKKTHTRASTIRLILREVVTPE